MEETPWPSAEHWHRSTSSKREKKAPIWEFVHKLTPSGTSEAAKRGFPGMTHICLLDGCATCLKLGNDGETWSTSLALRHFRKEHQEHPVALAAEAAQKNASGVKAVVRSLCFVVHCILVWWDCE